MRAERVAKLRRKATNPGGKDRDLILIAQRILDGIARGKDTVDEGRVVSHAQAKVRLARWLASSGPIHRCRA